MHFLTFLAPTTPHSKVSLLQSWHSRGNVEKQKILTIIHIPSVYLNRVLLFVCCSKFSITLRNIQLRGDRNTFERECLTFSTHPVYSVYF